MAGVQLLSRWKCMFWIRLLRGLDWHAASPQRDFDITCRIVNVTGHASFSHRTRLDAQEGIETQQAFCPDLGLSDGVSYFQDSRDRLEICISYNKDTEEMRLLNIAFLSFQPPCSSISCTWETLARTKKGYLGHAEGNRQEGVVTIKNVFTSRKD